MEQRVSVVEKHKMLQGFREGGDHIRLRTEKGLKGQKIRNYLKNRTNRLVNSSLRGPHK